MVGRHGGFADRLRVQWTWARPLPDALDLAKQGPAIRAGRHPDGPFDVEQPYSRAGRGCGAGENEANGAVDQCVARADRRRASFDQHVENRQIAGAAIDVFDIEPLPPSHPFRTLDNVLATPHIGYVSQGLYKTFYEDTVSNIRKWLDTH